MRNLQNSLSLQEHLIPMELTPTVFRNLGRQDNI